MILHLQSNRDNFVTFERLHSGDKQFLDRISHELNSQRKSKAHRNSDAGSVSLEILSYLTLEILLRQRYHHQNFLEVPPQKIFKGFQPTLSQYRRAVYRIWANSIYGRPTYWCCVGENSARIEPAVFCFSLIIAAQFLKPSFLLLLHRKMDVLVYLFHVVKYKAHTAAFTMYVFPPLPCFQNILSNTKICEEFLFFDTCQKASLVIRLCYWRLICQHFSYMYSLPDAW